MDRNELIALIGTFVRGEIPTSTFCDAYEHAYNFEIDRRGLAQSEEAAFEALFNEVVFYSPYSEEQSQVPNYRSEQEIRQAAKIAASQLES